MAFPRALLPTIAALSLHSQIYGWIRNAGYAPARHHGRNCCRTPEAVGKTDVASRMRPLRRQELLTAECAENIRRECKETHFPTEFSQRTLRPFPAVSAVKAFATPRVLESVRRISHRL